MIKKPKIPIRITAIPMIVKISDHSSGFSSEKPINPPNTTKIAISGIIELIPSALPLFSEVVTSVSHALKQASLALEPKNVIRQSKMITRVTQIALTLTAVGKIAPIISFLISTAFKNAKQRNTARCMILSLAS
jgi:hypothetical protein